MGRRAGSCLLILSVVVAALALPAGAVTNDTQRFEGADRYDTAVAVSAHSFGFPPIHAIYLASGEAFADALAGGPAAVERGPGPLLLTPRTTLPANVALSAP